jgi:alpha-galactosidase/6-phospho-beta-glucosidase family protein
MKAVFVGGGALRLMSILRGAMAVPGLFDGGEINLYDLDVERSEAMGKMLKKTPEYGEIDCDITWGTSLEEALEGADMVGIILMAGSRLKFRLGGDVSMRHGFLPSDNMSPNGAFLAMKGGPIVLDVARKMEKYCPDAWLVDFVNPVTVMSGIVNHHTDIKALGVCAGYTNHMADLTRIIRKRDEYQYDYDVDVAGVNHMSCIIRGTMDGEDIFPLLEEKTKNPMEGLDLRSSWPENTRKSIRKSIMGLAEIYRELGVMIFSSEHDGMKHLMYDKSLEEERKEFKPLSRDEIEQEVEQDKKEREKQDEWFRSHIDQELPESFWSGDIIANRIFGKDQTDIFVKVLKGIGGVERTKVVTSQPNDGAVSGFKARDVLEYSQYLDGDTAEPVEDLYVPDVVYGMTASLANHQTMLADAIATGDPKLLAHALRTYPIRPYSEAQKELYRELFEINADEIPSKLKEAKGYL